MIRAAIADSTGASIDLAPKSVLLSARWLLLVLVALSIGGCALRPIPGNPTNIAAAAQSRWHERLNRLAPIDHFSLQGRLAEHGLTGSRGDLSWVQTGAHFEVRVSGPLGIGALLISGEPQSVSVRTKDGEFKTDDPLGFMQEQFGWSLPIARLRYWVLGLPATGNEENPAPSLILDNSGRLTALSQDGWQVSFTEYRLVTAGRTVVELPRKIELDDGKHRFLLVIDQWNSVENAGAR